MSQMRRMALVSAATVVALALLVRFNQEPDVVVGETVWAYDAGGFSMAIPASWEPTAAEPDPFAGQSAVVLGSEYRRRVGGLILPRYLTVRTLDFGEPPLPIRLHDFAEMVVRARVPDEILGRAAPAAGGVSVLTYRVGDRGDPLSQAGVFFLGRGARAFMVEITSHRRDEALLVEEAWRIADSVEHEHSPLSDLTILMANTFAVPFSQINVAWRATPESGGGLFFNAPLSMVMDVIDPEACRAAAISVWGRSLQDANARGLVSTSPFLEMTASCRTSTATIRLEQGLLSLRQVDANGEMIFEHRVPTRLLFTTVGGTPFTVLRTRVGG